MPMRIVNLKGGSGGGGTVVNSDSSGLFKMTHHTTPSGASNITWIRIYSTTDKSKPKPKEIMVMFNGRTPWNAAKNSNSPPNPGTAFGIKIFKGDEVPEKIYVHSQFSNPPGFDYGNGTKYSLLATDEHFNNKFGLPNPCNSREFVRQDNIAPDAKTHHIGDWDFIANGGNGIFTNGGGDIDSCGSNGSMFGDGKTSFGRYPSSCGAPGTTTERGLLAHGITYNKVFDSFKSILSFAQEQNPVIPSGSNINNVGGSGALDFVLTENVEFGMANGVPFIPAPVKIKIYGGYPVVGRNAAPDDMGIKLDILYKY